MKRRNFLTTSIGGGALISSAVPVVAQSAQSLSLLTNDPLSANALKARIETTTGGAMSLDVQAVTNVDASGLLDRVGNGDANMCLVSLDNFLEKNLAFGMFASMPFGMTAGELSSWILASDGRDMLEALGGEYGVSIHLITDHGNLPMWSKAPIADVASLAGLSVGSTGLGIRSLQAAGVASVVDLRDPSVDWTGLDVIDGASVVEMQEKDLLETFTNLSATNPNKPSTLSALVVNNATMAAFSENEAVTVVRACSAELTDSSARVFHEGAVTVATLGDAITAYDLPQDVWGALNAASRSVLKDIFDSGGLEASVVDAYIYFLTDVSAWSDIGEAAYFTGRKRLTAV